jgi:hypothetical protein
MKYPVQILLFCLIQWVTLAKEPSAGIPKNLFREDEPIGKVNEEVDERKGAVKNPESEREVFGTSEKSGKEDLKKEASTESENDREISGSSTKVEGKASGKGNTQLIPLPFQGKCNSLCFSSKQCGDSCPVCSAGICQQCQSDRHCFDTFGSAKPYCKSIFLTKKECRADTCKMACLSSSDCKGSCPACYALKCQQCHSDNHCRDKFGSAKPYCRRTSLTERECSADTCSMTCLSSNECRGSCGVCFAAKCQQCRSDLDCRATFGSDKPYCKRISLTKRECRAHTCSMACLKSSQCKGECGKCCGFQCKESCDDGCFPGDSFVMINGEMKKMENLRIGDVIMTVKNGEMVPTKVLGFLDKRINQTTVYLEVILDDNRSLFISPRHTMFIVRDENTLQSILAKDVGVGDTVIVDTGKEAKFGRVKDVRMEHKKGAYVPLTDLGTLLVDGVLVSSYTNTNHWLAHNALAPLRWWPTWLLDDEESQDLQGIRTFPLIIRKVGNVLGLVTMAEKKTKTTGYPLKATSMSAIEDIDGTEVFCNVE